MIGLKPWREPKKLLPFSIVKNGDIITTDKLAFWCELRTVLVLRLGNIKGCIKIYCKTSREKSMNEVTLSDAFFKEGILTLTKEDSNNIIQLEAIRKERRFFYFVIDATEGECDSLAMDTIKRYSSSEEYAANMLDINLIQKK